MESKFGSLTIPELKSELKKRSAKQSGRKKELVERLDAYDRNKNFGQSDVQEPDFYITVPEPNHYSDINSDTKFCDVKLNSVVDFLEQFDKTMDTSIQIFYREKFLQYFRVANNFDDKIYVKSSCHAEMRKGIVYKVDVVYNKEGLVLETQCECAAGMGPSAHCKHVCIVLYASTMFSKMKTIITEETCTQKLMSFNKCKKFIGSPVKASNLNVLRADEFTNIDFDPRPMQFRNRPEYSDYFRNTCLNHPQISKMPIFQTIKPANNRAIALDHDYFKLTPEEHFLEAMCITKISQNEIKSVESRTLGQSSNMQWAEERTKRLPSSMFGRICKATDRTDKDKLAKSLTEVVKVNAQALRHGRRYEDAAISRYMSDTQNIVKRSGILVAREYPFLSCSPDGIVNDFKIVEVKCPFSARDQIITPSSVPYIKINSESNCYLEQKHNYYFQIQGQLLCTGAQECDLIIYTITDVKYLKVYRNNTFIESMVADLKLFFDNHFKMAILEKYFYKTYID